MRNLVLHGVYCPNTVVICEQRQNGNSLREEHHCHISLRGKDRKNSPFFLFQNGGISLPDWSKWAICIGVQVYPVERRGSFAHIITKGGVYFINYRAWQNVVGEEL